MAEIFQFKPKATLTAAENLEAFISKCRDQLTVFGSDIDWEEPVWPNITVFAKLGVITRKPVQERYKTLSSLILLKPISVTSKCIGPRNKE